MCINPLNAELNPIYHLLALLGAHHIFHVRGLRVNIFHGVLLLDRTVVKTDLLPTVRTLIKRGREELKNSRKMAEM